MGLVESTVDERSIRGLGCLMNKAVKRELAEVDPDKPDVGIALLRLEPCSVALRSGVCKTSTKRYSALGEYVLRMTWQSRGGEIHLTTSYLISELEVESQSDAVERAWDAIEDRILAELNG